MTIVGLVGLVLLVFGFASLVADRFDKDQRPYEFSDGGIVLKPGHYTKEDILAILSSFLPRTPDPVLVLVHDGYPTAHYESIAPGAERLGPTPMAPFAATEAQAAPATPTPAPMASGWTLVKFPQGQPACTGVGFIGAVYYDRLDCGFGYVRVSETNQDPGPGRSIVKVSFIDSSGTTRNTQTTTARTQDVAWQFNTTPGASWTPGTVIIRVSEVDPDGTGPQPNQIGNFGETTFILNQLGASIGVLPKPGDGAYQPGDDVQLAGATFEIDQVPPLAAPQERGVAATFSLRVVLPDGSVRGPFGPHTSDVDGDFTATLPGSATDGLAADASTNFEIAVSIEAVDATFTDAITGAWSADRAGAAPLVFTVPPSTLIVENSFVSAVGWVKPGDAYPSRIFVKNFTDTPATGVQVVLDGADGMAFVSATTAKAWHPSRTCRSRGPPGRSRLGPTSAPGC